MTARTRLLLAASLSVVAFLALSASANAEEAWWNLNAGSNPTNLHAGLAQSEVQELSTTTTEFEGHPEQAAFEVSVGETNLGIFATEPLATELGFTPLTAPELQSALETVYGAGNVEVTRQPGSEPLSFLITSKAAKAFQEVPAVTVEPLGVGEPEAKVLTPGRSDGEVYITAANVGDASLAVDEIPVKVAATLPPGLRAVAIVGNGPGPEGAWNLVSPLSCSLESLSCSLTKHIGESGVLFDSLTPFHRLNVRISVVVEPGAESGEPVQVNVSGGRSFHCNEVPAGTGIYRDEGCTAGASTELAFKREALAPVASASIERPTRIDGSPTPFGAEDYSLNHEEEGGAIDTRASSHPFQQTTTIVLNRNEDLKPTGPVTEVSPAGLVKDLDFHWPAGLLGNTSHIARCTDSQFFGMSKDSGYANSCPPGSAVGVSLVTVHDPGTLGYFEVAVPFFNLTPHYGEPARFGFIVPLVNAPVIIDSKVRNGGDYGLTVHVDNITQIASFISSEVTVWGTPGDPRHDQLRNWNCLNGSAGQQPYRPSEGGWGPCHPQAEQHPQPFLFLPASCGSTYPNPVLGDSWAQSFDHEAFPQLAEFPLPALGGCNKVPFAPTIHSEPTSDAATSPTGLNFDINVNDEGLENGEGLVASPIKKAVVTLPQGFTTNPSVAEGLHACTEAQFNSETVDSAPGAGCPNESKIGDIEIESPLIEGHKVLGSLFVATQHENTYGNLLTLDVVAKNPELGIFVKQALKVTPDPKTGQLTTEVDNIPQLPFSHFRLGFRQGQRSPLITPSACGTYAVKAKLYPYSNPEVPVERESAFQITTGPEGNPCPSGGLPPFHPVLEAGTINNAAGTFSPFVTKITRKDSEQEITHFSIKLPPGVIGKLAGVAECSDGAIAAAKAREHEGGGAEELNSPSCPATSEVGHTLVGSGVGNVLAYAPGKLYLAGPYHGSNLSLVAITAAKVGPFDLGTVVVRFALRIDPETAEVFVDATGSDPIPHIVDGIPVHLRDIRSYVDRPDFTLNPTNCTRTSTASTVLGSGLDFASEADDRPITVSSPFQAADCAALPFKPRLALSLKGGTKRGAHPAFKAVLKMNGIGESGVARTQVTLPRSEFIENAHFNTICTRAQFKAGAGNGAECPAGSVYGKARAVTPILGEPLTGPIFLRSSEHKLPDVVVALHNKQVNVVLDGRVDSVKGQLRNTFESTPDAPVSEVVLELDGGKKGLFVNSTNLCAATHRAIADFTGQNGKEHDFNPAVKAQGCGGKAKKHKAQG